MADIIDNLVQIRTAYLLQVLRELLKMQEEVSKLVQNIGDDNK